MNSLNYFIKFLLINLNKFLDKLILWRKKFNNLQKNMMNKIKLFNYEKNNFI